MSIGLKGFKTKTLFKHAVADAAAAAAKGEGEAYKMELGKNYVETSLFSKELVPNKLVSFVGPDAYYNRKWYGNVLVDENYIVQKVI